MTAQLRSELRKLRTDHVDLMMLHNVKKADQSLAYLRDWKAQKLTRYVGISSTFSRDSCAALRIAARSCCPFCSSGTRITSAS